MSNQTIIEQIKNRNSQPMKVTKGYVLFTILFYFIFFPVGILMTIDMIFMMLKGNENEQ